MGLKGVKYERRSTLKSCSMNLNSTWDEVKSKIASAFDMEVTAYLIEGSSLIANSELVQDESIPTLKKYLYHHKCVLGHTVFVLYAPEAEDEGK